MATDTQIKDLVRDVSTLCQMAKLLESKRQQVISNNTTHSPTWTTAGIGSSNPDLLEDGVFPGTSITQEDVSNALGAFAGGTDAFADFWSTNDTNIEKLCPPIV